MNALKKLIRILKSFPQPQPLKQAIFLLSLLFSVCSPAYNLWAQMPSFSTIEGMINKASYEDVKKMMGDTGLDIRNKGLPELNYKIAESQWNFRFYNNKLHFFRYSNNEEQAIKQDVNTIQKMLHNGSGLRDIIAENGAPGEVKMTPYNSRLVYTTDHQLIEFTLAPNNSVQTIYMDDLNTRITDNRLSYPEVKAISKVQSERELLKVFGAPSQVLASKEGIQYRYIAVAQKPNTSCTLSVSIKNTTEKSPVADKGSSRQAAEQTNMLEFAYEYQDIWSPSSFDTNTLGSLKAGVTTTAQVLQLLGMPQEIHYKTDVEYWQYSGSKGKADIYFDRKNTVYKYFIRP
ncbi:hypothetical protein DBR32_03085 [Taibaiella sp. KBW10]|nr:hypothetical protein DBR32_03085 [Taibaiella sp. KBW10]